MDWVVFSLRNGFTYTVVVVVGLVRVVINIAVCVVTVVGTDVVNVLWTVSVMVKVAVFVVVVSNSTVLVPSLVVMTVLPVSVVGTVTVLKSVVVTVPGGERFSSFVQI
jgi:hypothetical protein